MIKAGTTKLAAPEALLRSAALLVRAPQFIPDAERQRKRSEQVTRTKIPERSSRTYRFASSCRERAIALKDIARPPQKSTKGLSNSTI